MKKILFSLKLFLFFAIALSITQSSFAEGVAISPIRVELSAKTPIASLTVYNRTDQLLIMQIQPKLWIKGPNGSTYSDTKDILVTPPIFSVPSMKQQLIRVALRRQPSPNETLTYRIYFVQVPSNKLKDANAIQLILRIGVPVYVAPLSAPMTKKT